MNCIIAQSGGPTSVINASVYGLVKENFNLEVFDNVYGGLNGIQGILEKKIINLSSMNKDELEAFKNTPSSGLGSCRYKLKDFSENEYEYIKLIKILKELDIKAFFYVGGNDSMDTTAKLSKYAKKKNLDIKFIGIPKTIDNDLVLTDHTPGFGSAAKFIATATLETYLDSTVYMDNGIFIIEAMGRDTGWLAASAALAQINGKPCADFIYLPESEFSITDFLNDVRKTFKEKNHVYIVASEGLRDCTGKFITQSAYSAHDKFGHAQLGGVGEYLKNLIMDAGITKRVKALELGVMQRCAMHCASKTDLDEAIMVGAAAIRAAAEGKSGYMVSIKRETNSPYKSSTVLVDANEIANKIKHFPKEWINKKGNHITVEAINYLRPLIADNVLLDTEDLLPKYKVFSR
ncbi:6-phosphofructokinase [Clostridium cavendishii DSM 21758]|uniref:Pyrophosphate--fructose 6-phosphate 1-phosphotransferase n=1 Tax=Clostridium cavendishii DSM 21758 TaxID=1121302 RepID=A0A1M6CQR7_9CLOT|nr:6-phosphofructokinase [Clostridium cavendishii]SHI63134.1 6-phosphofructokinase [Clostridium cavendishii DSM 21758]